MREAFRSVCSRAVELREKVFECRLQQNVDALYAELMGDPRHVRTPSYELGGLSPWVETLRTLQHPREADEAAAQIK